MGTIKYDVPLVEQGDNPICWVACMAMVASERTGSSVTVGRYTGGFEPFNSCIPDPAGAASNWDLIGRLIRQAGFNNTTILPTTAAIEDMLRTNGPFIFTHDCANFAYGTGWPPVTEPGATHAVVITGFNSTDSGGMCLFNNPWGNKDRKILAATVIGAIIAWQSSGQFQVSHWAPALPRLYSATRH